MFHNSSSLNESEDSRYSDTEVSSFGSSSDEDLEPTFELDDSLLTRQFLSTESPKISRKVLSTDIQEFNYIPSLESHQANRQNNTSQNNENLDSNLPQNTEDIKDTDKLHSNEIHKKNQEIKRISLELKKSEDQLRKLFENSNKEPHEETVLEKIKKDVEVVVNKESKPLPVQMNIFQQVAVANFQIDKAQIQLLDYFSGINSFDESEHKSNKEDQLKMKEKVNKAKEISDFIQHIHSPSPNQEQSSTIQKTESFDDLYHQVRSSINELNKVQEKLDELLQM